MVAGTAQMRVTDVAAKTVLAAAQVLPVSIGPFEIRAGAFTLLLGLWLAGPQGTFVSASGYAVLARLLPEWAWATMLLVLGALQILMAAFRFRLGARRVLAMMLTGLWGGWAVCFMVANPASLAIPIYVLAMADQAVVYLRIGLDEPLRAAQDRG